jgi:CheY-like chemotaxis protein
MHANSAKEIAVISLRTKPTGNNGDGPNGTDADGESRPRIQERGSLYCASEVRILVMDDDEGVCRVIQAAFAPQGFVIDTISEPARVEAQLKARSYHVIVLDYVIPGLQAEQILEWIREHQPDASIIVVTAYPSIDSALSCLRARTYDYITKPFQIAHLQRVVTRCLESAAGPRTGSRRGGWPPAVRLWPVPPVAPSTVPSAAAAGLLTVSSFLSGAAAGPGAASRPG